MACCSLRPTTTTILDGFWSYYWISLISWIRSKTSHGGGWLFPRTADRQRGEPLVYQAVAQVEGDLEWTFWEDTTSRTSLCWIHLNWLNAVIIIIIELYQTWILTLLPSWHRFYLHVRTFLGNYIMSRSLRQNTSVRQKSQAIDSTHL